MRLLLGALMIALAIAAAANVPDQIRNADRRGGQRGRTVRRRRLADFRSDGHPLA